MAHRHRSFVALAAVVALASGCAALRDDMVRAENAYEAAKYEEALVWLEDLESETPDMEPAMRARFYYLRGMTAYRLGKRNHALHYLAVAREVADEGGGTLKPGWRDTLDRTLAELTPTDASFRARGPNEGGEGAPEGDPSEGAGASSEQPASSGGEQPAEPAPTGSGSQGTDGGGAEAAPAESSS